MTWDQAAALKIRSNQLPGLEEALGAPFAKFGGQRPQRRAAPQWRLWRTENQKHSHAAHANPSPKCPQFRFHFEPPISNQPHQDEPRQ